MAEAQHVTNVLTDDIYVFPTKFFTDQLKMEYPNMYKRLLVITILLLSMTLIGATAQIAAQEDELDDARFFLTFVPNIQFSPVYVMIANGHAADAGINFIIEHGDENVGVDLIASNAIPFGIVSGEQVIMARAGQRPVVYVYEWFQQFPVGIVVPDTTAAETVSDLQGIKVGIPGRFGASYSGLTALLDANDMTEDDIQLEAIGFAAPDVVCVGGVDASVVYVNNEPLQLAQRAINGDCGDITSVSVIKVSDYADMVSNGLVTSEELIENNPELVRTVVVAFDRGVRDVINNPAQAYLISLDYVDNLPISSEFRAALENASTSQIDFLATNPSREAVAESRIVLLNNLSAHFDNEALIQFRVLMSTLELWDAEYLGYTESQSWELTLSILDTMGMLPGEVDLQGAYTNEFLPLAAEEVAE
jgi:NitT/TauT family transport system substrate-binding protein